MMIGLYFLTLQHLPPETPIFYSLPESDNQIAPMWMILMLPIIESILVGLNYIVKKRWFHEPSLFSTMLIYTTYAVIVIMTVIFVSIIVHIT